MYHVRLCGDMGFLVVETNYPYVATALTWEGHELPEQLIKKYGW